MKESVIFGLIDATTLIVYALALAMALHNIVKYLFLQKRYQKNNNYLVAFYFNTVMVLCLRIIQFSISSSDHAIQWKRLTYTLGTSAVLFQFNIGGCMLILMQNLQTSCYSIFTGQQYSYSNRQTIFIFFAFLIFDAPFAYFMATYDVLGTCNYIAGVFALLFVLLSISTLRVIRSINRL